MRDSILKKSFLVIWDKFNDIKKMYYIRKYYVLPIMTAEDTIAYIKKNNCSIARYGDGELDIMLQKGEPNFQEGSEKIALELLKVFENTSRNLLICLPRSLVSTKGFESWAKKFWRGWAREKQIQVVQAIREVSKEEYHFGDAYLSRPYTAYKSRKYSQKMFSLLKELWVDRDILIVEGEQTRLGVGNDLFKNTKSIKRILAPAQNAFDCFSEILDSVLAHWRDELVILALGPTATILALYLSQKGIQALDMGHIDIQYEWYLEGGKNFTPVEGKYTNEAKGGNEVTECNDVEYLSQIIEIVQKNKEI